MERSHVPCKGTTEQPWFQGSSGFVLHGLLNLVEINRLHNAGGRKTNTLTQHKVWAPPITWSYDMEGGSTMIAQKWLHKTVPAYSRAGPKNVHWGMSHAHGILVEEPLGQNLEISTGKLHTPEEYFCLRQICSYLNGAHLVPVCSVLERWILRLSVSGCTPPCSANAMQCLWQWQTVTHNPSRKLQCLGLGQ